MNEFKLTAEEANILDRIASATKMDCWFYIDENLHVQDIEEPQSPGFGSDAEGVCLLEDGLAYDLSTPQSGSLTPNEIMIATACFRRARNWIQDNPKPGTWVVILDMEGEPSYKGAVGQVLSIDDAGQIHGTWGGCAIVPGRDRWETVANPDPTHYNDGLIDIRDVQEFCLMELVSSDGKTASVSYDSNFFSPADIVSAYVSLAGPNAGDEAIRRLKAWLIAAGCDPEDFE